MSASPFTLAGDAVHAWMFNWKDCPDPEHIKNHLLPEEQTRAERYKIPEDRARYSFARMMLRYLSGEYLDCDGKSLSMVLGNHGKPDWTGAGECLKFNVSHSGDWVFLAFAMNCPVGIDVQNINKRAGFDCLKLARYNFHADEVAMLEELSAPHMEFFNIWAAKEAVIKATGNGLYEGLQKFSVLPLPAEGHWNPVKGIDNICLGMLDVDQYHTGALAVQEDKCRRTVMEFGVSDIKWPL